MSKRKRKARKARTAKVSGKTVSWSDIVIKVDPKGLDVFDIVEINYSDPKYDDKRTALGGALPVDDALKIEKAVDDALKIALTSVDGGETVSAPKGLDLLTPVRREGMYPSAYAAQNPKNAIEADIPLPYVGHHTGVEGKVDVSNFVFEYVSHTFEPAVEFHWNGYKISEPKKKHLTLVAKVRPRVGVEDIAPEHVDSRGLTKLFFHQKYDIDRPDAVCVRELFLLALRHELEESIMVNGVRIWDPHVGRPGDI